MAGKPKPFSRPSMTLGGGTPVTREWQHVTPDTLSVGDTVADFGLLTKVDEGIFHMVLDNVSGDQSYAPFDRTVFAFTRPQ